jgi:hippurate hydrolase
MLDDGLFERFPCDAVYGMHNMPGLPLGHFALCDGPMMAGSGRWKVQFRGTGGHGGNSPHLASDITVAQANFITALQSIVSRNTPALESVVISVGHISGGSVDALNVMPSEILVGGTMRAFNPTMQKLLEDRMREVAELTARMQGASAEVTLWWGAAPLINHTRETSIMADTARELVGDSAVNDQMTPVTGGEDFAFMLRAKPGAFVFMGNGTAPDGKAHALHTPLYDFNDAALPHGVAFWVNLVRREMNSVE